MKTNKPLTIVYRKVDDIKPYARNARTHSERQLKLLMDSITQFDFVTPLAIDAQGTLLAGHGRFEAAKRLGMIEVPTVCLDHLDDIEKRAYIVADNRIAEQAGWDMELLSLEIGELVALETDFEITLTGFDMGAIDVMLQPNPDDVTEDEEQLPGGPAVSRPGDIWILDKHRLICGNALNADDYQRLMGNELADMVFTDPPYNVKINGHVSGKGKAQHKEFAMASGEMTEAAFQAFLDDALNLMARYSKDGSIHDICMDAAHLDTLMAAAKAHYTELKNICVWVKHNAGMGSLYRSQHEMVLIYKKGTAPHTNNVVLGAHGRYRTNVWKYHGANVRGGPENLLALHPTVKPVGLVADAILDCSDRKGIILDPFNGSGTTILAAERTGRQARAIELEPQYVDVTIRRWQQRTGKHAILEGTDITFGQYEAEGRDHE